MHSNIKVRTIVNIINVYNRYKSRIEIDERKYEYYKSVGDKTAMILAEIELKKDQAKMSEFLDYYVWISLYTPKLITWPLNKGFLL